MTANHYEEVHPPVERNVITRFPSHGTLALYAPNDDEPFIAGQYISLKEAR